MSPSVSELQDVLDWEAASVLQALDDDHGATVETLAERTNIDRETVENRCQQLTTIGLATDVTVDGAAGYELTGQGHAAIGAGLLEGYEFLGDGDIDALAEEVAGLLDRRDELAAEVEQLVDDAQTVEERARRQFGDRDDVDAEFESLLEDLQALAETLDED